MHSNKFRKSNRCKKGGGVKRKRERERGVDEKRAKESKTSEKEGGFVACFGMIAKAGDWPESYFATAGVSKLAGKQAKYV